MSNHNVPGASIALVTRDKRLWIDGIGYSNIATGTPVDVNTIFRWGSVSKSFVAVSIQILAERGLVHLEDRIRDVVPEIEVHSRWESTHPVRFQPLRNLQRVGLGSLDAKTHGLQPSKREECLVGIHIAANGHHRIAETPEQISIVGDENAAHQIGVAIDELRDRVKHDVGAEFQRPLQVRTREGVVHRQEAPVLVRNLGSSAC